MAPRANRKTHLKLSLVSCAVQLYPATTAKDRIAFHLLNRETGNRLRRQLIDQVTGRALSASASSCWSPAAGASRLAQGQVTIVALTRPAGRFVPSFDCVRFKRNVRPRSGGNGGNRFAA